MCLITWQQKKIQINNSVCPYVCVQIHMYISTAIKPFKGKALTNEFNSARMFIQIFITLINIELKSLQSIPSYKTSGIFINSLIIKRNKRREMISCNARLNWYNRKLVKRKYIKYTLLKKRYLLSM